MARGERAQKIREMYQQGMRPSQIAKALGIKPQAVHAALKPLRRKAEEPKEDTETFAVPLS